MDAFIATPAELEPFLGQYPQVEIGGSLREEGDKGFILGTNQIGQDIFSRIIWGTKIALIVGLSFGITVGDLRRSAGIDQRFRRWTVGSCVDPVHG